MNTIINDEDRQFYKILFATAIVVVSFVSYAV